jgi:ankyrin repeat protein
MRGTPIETRLCCGRRAGSAAARRSIALRLLLERGADVKATNRRGETPLILAATQHETDGIRLLLSPGC